MKRVYIVMTVMVVALIVACTAKPDPTEWLSIQIGSTADSSHLDPSTIAGRQRVKIIGTINATDFEKLREITSLYHLDLSEATIVGTIIVANQTETTSQITQMGNAIPAGAFGQILRLRPGGDTLYTAHKSIRSIIFPPNLSTIGQNAFFQCGLNTPIILPQTVSRIYDSAFNSCGYLTGEIQLPSQMLYLGVATFFGCANITGSISIPESMDSVSGYLFTNCVGITEVSMGQRVRKIGKYAFAATSISQIDLPAGLISIEQGAFRNCRSLRGSLNLPSQITTVGAHAFEYAGYDERLTLPASIQTIGRSAFDSTNFEFIEMNWDDPFLIPAWDTSKHWFPERFEVSKYTHQFQIFVPRGTLTEYQRHFNFEGKVFYNLTEK